MTDTVSETEVSFEVWQDGDMVAAADSLADAEHFMLVYGQDGPVEAKTAITTRFPGFNVDTAMLAASPQGEGSSADAPVEAVAWRFWHEGGWNFSLADPSPHLADCVERDALYTHPAPIKPSGDTGELRERVARIVDPAGFDDRWDVPGLRHEASLDERVDEALAKADAILDLIQSERGKAVPMTAQDLADHAADAFDNALPDDALPHEVGRAWKAVGERLAAILAERAKE